jgi:hypothetical protein
MESLSGLISISHQDDFLSEKAVDGTRKDSQMGDLSSRGMKQLHDAHYIF